MAIINDNSKCILAMPYYADYLSCENDDIPREIIQHISGCDACKKEIAGLSHILNGGSSENLDSRADTLNRNMELHMAFLNHPVTCTSARPFLPLQASEILSVSTTTPITAHIDNCRQCRADLEKIKRWGLSKIQLCELSMALTTHNENSDLSFLENDTASSEVKTMIARDDFCSSTLRVDNDRNRPDKFSLEITEQTAQTVKLKNKRRFPAIASKLVAAAACFIVIYMLFFNDSGLNATDFKEMYKSLKNVQNICLKQYGTEGSEPVQTTWISNTANLMILQNKGEISITDLNNNIYKYKNFETSKFISKEIKKEALTNIKKSMDLPWGILPFTHIKDLPKGAVWRKVREKSSAEYEVFELIWSRQNSETDTNFYLWRCYLETDSKLPLRTESESRHNPEDEYELTGITEINYPDQSEIMAVADSFEAGT